MVTNPGDSKCSNKKPRLARAPKELPLCKLCDDDDVGPTEATVYCASCGRDLCDEHSESAHAAAAGAEMSSHSRVPLKDKSALLEALVGGARDVFQQSAAARKEAIKGASQRLESGEEKLDETKKTHTGKATHNKLSRTSSSLQPAGSPFALMIACLPSHDIRAVRSVGRSRAFAGCHALRGGQAHQARARAASCELANKSEHVTGI